MAAAIALGELGDSRAMAELKLVLATQIWDLKYAALMSLTKLGDASGAEIAQTNSDWLIQAKAQSLTSLSTQPIL